MLIVFCIFKMKSCKVEHTPTVYLSQAKLRLKAAHGGGGALQLHVFLANSKIWLLNAKFQINMVFKNVVLV